MPIIRLGVRLTMARLRRVAVFFCLLALLCAGAGLLGAHFLYSGQAVDLIVIALVDRDDTMETRLFYSFLTGMTEYADLIRFDRLEEDEAMALLEAGEVSAVFDIPPGFTQSVLVGQNDPFTIVLDSDSTLKTTMISLFVDAYTDMLHTGQVGVFAALDIAYEEAGREGYDEMFRVVNLRFLSAMLNRGQLQSTEYLSAIGGTSTVAYYAAAAYVFVCFLGAVLFLDQYRSMAAPQVLLRLRAGGRGSLRCTAGLFVAAALPFLMVALLCVGALAALGSRIPGISLAGLLPGLLLTALCAGAFCVVAALLFQSGMAGSVFVTVFSLCCLVLSGGVLPVAYFTAPLQAASRLTPNLWLSRLLIQGMAGAPGLQALAGGAAYLGVLFLLCWAGVARRGKVGAAA